MPDDTRYMRRALELAERGLGETNPNPLVGCVIVSGGRIVGEGFHARPGGPHAEVVALARAGRRARGSTLYVNLEPCAHTDKRTPPCAPLIPRAGVARVVVAMRDPNPQVRGRGLGSLRRAGLRVECGLLRNEAARLNERFVVSKTRARPFVLLKAALTLDGCLATASGDSRWITSAAQRRRARALRRCYDAVLVGIGTALADDPRLLPSPPVKRQFHRVILDSRLRLPPGGRLVASARRWPVLVLGHERAARRRALEARGVEVVVDGLRSGRLALDWVMKTLHARGITSVMVEGGSEVLGSFLAAGLFDQVALFRAPLLLGGRESRPAFGGPDPRSIADGFRLVGPGSPAFELWYPGGRSPRTTLARGTRTRRSRPGPLAG